jgi:hypothetical protein
VEKAEQRGWRRWRQRRSKATEVIQSGAVKKKRWRRQSGAAGRNGTTNKADAAMGP